MDLRQLSYFVCIVRAGSLSKAASLLHVSQPSLGEHVRNLEAELGVQLLVRHSRGVTPTDAGKTLLERADHLLRYADETREMIGALSGSVSGNVTIGMSPGINEMFSADLLDRCMADLPGVCLNIVEDLSAVLVSRVAEEAEEMNVALVSGFDVAHHRGIDAKPLATEELYVVGSPSLLPGRDEPISFRSLCRLPLVLLGSGRRDQPHGMRRFLEELANDLGVEIDVYIELRSVAAVRELLQRSAGVAILPIACVRRWVADGDLVARTVTGPKLRREIHIVSTPQARLGRAELAVARAVTSLVASIARRPDCPYPLAPVPE